VAPSQGALIQGLEVEFCLVDGLAQRKEVFHVLFAQVGADMVDHIVNVIGVLDHSDQVEVVVYAL
jgi:hypothetical protein